MVKKILFFFSLFFVLLSCNAKIPYSDNQLKVGASRTEDYIPLLLGKRVAMVVNHTAVVDGVHLLDSLLLLGVDVKKVFAPEHGFRGDGDAGEIIASSIDKKSGRNIVSLYGKNKKPSAESLKDVDVVVFDIQDVGVRFYTYISTLKLVMEACAENHIRVIVLDRPNPNGDYVDGAVLRKGFESFVGSLPIPVVYGTTIGELAMMINGERWLGGGIKCDLTVIRLKNYIRTNRYHLSIKPSPNLPNDRAIRLYPSLCFFEGTTISVGRGTDYAFQVIGYPNSKLGDFEFTPQSLSGMAKNPLHENKKCFGLDLREGSDGDQFTLKYLLQFYKVFPDKEFFFTSAKFFNLLAGNDLLIQQIQTGLTESEIRKSWEIELIKYKQIRVKYLLYP